MLQPQIPNRLRVSLTEGLLYWYRYENVFRITLNHTNNVSMIVYLTKFLLSENYYRCFHAVKHAHKLQVKVLSKVNPCSLQS